MKKIVVFMLLTSCNVLLSQGVADVLFNFKSFNSDSIIIYRYNCEIPCNREVLACDSSILNRNEEIAETAEEKYFNLNLDERKILFKILTDSLFYESNYLKESGSCVRNQIGIIIWRNKEVYATIDININCSSLVYSIFNNKIILYRKKHYFYEFGVEMLSKFLSEIEFEICKHY